MRGTMNKTLVILGIALIVVGLALLALLLVPWFAGDDVGSAAGDMDRHFIEEMIPHHEDAVSMSELALTKAEHTELRDLARAIIQNQTQEIDDMRSWYLSWYGTEVSEDTGEFRGPGGGMMGGGMMHDEADMEVLKAAAVFDQEFIGQMIPHHQMGVMMARMVLARTDRPEIEQLAQSIIETQTNEIELMRDWYREWYE